MNPQHTEDYKQTAVKYYLEHNEDMRNTCEIFNCKFQSLARWVEKYKQNGNINRKTRKNHNLIRMVVASGTGTAMVRLISTR